MAEMIQKYIIFYLKIRVDYQIDQISNFMINEIKSSTFLYTEICFKW